MMQRVSKFLPSTLRTTKNLRLASTKTPPSKSSAQPMSEGAMDVQIYGGLKDQVSLPPSLYLPHHISKNFNSQSILQHEKKNLIKKNPRTIKT